MHRTIGDSYGLDGGNRIFREESVGNWDATQYQANDANAMQEEIAAVIEDAGIGLNTAPEAIGSMNQMSTVIQNYITAEALARNVNDRILSGVLVRAELNDMIADFLGATKVIEVSRALSTAIQGFLMSRTATTVIINQGFAVTEGDDAGVARLTSSISKSTATWVIGDANGGTPSTLLPLVADTWYHVFVIKRDSDGVIDAGIDTAINAANLLTDSSFDSYRRVGSVYWESTLNWRPFAHDLNEHHFIHHAVIDISSGTIPGPPTVSTISLAEAVPPGLSLPVDVEVRNTYTGTSWIVNWWDGKIGSASRAGAALLLAGLTTEEDREVFRLVTNVSQQVFAEPRPPTGGAPGTIVRVPGYIDRRTIVPV